MFSNGKKSFILFWEDSAFWFSELGTRAFALAILKIARESEQKKVRKKKSESAERERKAKAPSAKEKSANSRFFLFLPRPALEALFQAGVYVCVWGVCTYVCGDECVWGCVCECIYIDKRGRKETGSAEGNQ